MAIVRRATDLDATWARAWTADDVADLAAVVGSGVDDAHHGDIAYVTATGLYYLFLDDGTWFPLNTGAGTGDVTGPGVSVDGEIVLFDGTTGTLIKRATGTGFVKATSGVYAAGTLTQALGITIDGGGSALTTGVKGYLLVPFACTIIAATLLADQSGSAVVDVWKDTYANAPPTDADSITASAPPTLSSAIKSQDTTLTGWTTSIAAGDVLGFNVDSATTITRLTLQLTVTRTS